MEKTIDEIADAIALVLRCKWSLADGQASVYKFRRGSSEKTVPEERLLEIQEELLGVAPLGETSILTPDGAEFLMQTSSAMRMITRREDGLLLEDKHADFRYSLSRASDGALFYFLFKLLEVTPAPVLRLSRPSVLMARDFANEELSIQEVVLETLRWQTLRIDTKEQISIGEWQSYVESFIFHMSYNMDISMMPERSVEELARPSKIRNMRRSRIDELDAPHRTYVRDLVYSYQMGISADSAMLEYISYYHVAEYWFQHVYQDDLVAQVQEVITSPGFSYKRKNDVNSLIKRISQAVQARDSELVINEATALRLTLEKYVNLAELAKSVNAFDSTLARHYSSQNVPFSGGDAFDLESPDIGATFAALARRIYKTRNAVVHSKDGGKSKFIPFTHDRELEPEVPLIRFIAEQIIIETSSAR